MTRWPIRYEQRRVVVAGRSVIHSISPWVPNRVSLLNLDELRMADATSVVGANQHVMHVRERAFSIKVVGKNSDVFEGRLAGRPRRTAMT